MFNALTDRLSMIMKKMRGWGSLSENNIREGLREIRLALLEADVNYKVVKEFVDGATEEALGEEVIKSVTPAQQFTKVVYDRLVEALGSVAQDLDIRGGGISTLMLVGLQGSGKTTTAVKLAHYVLKHFNKKPLLVAADVYRPAAVKQLELLAEKNGFEVFARDETKPLAICREALAYAHEKTFGAVIIDTAGRLELDERMMGELVELRKSLNPQEVLLVADAATGQAAVAVAQGFNEKVGLTGIILSRMDSDARGGAALSMSHITGKNIKFIGTGEKVTDFDRFYPPGVASRILDMGDVVSLVEKVQRDLDAEKAKQLEKKIKKDSFDFDDFLDQLGQLRKMGSLENVIDMIPGLPKKANLKVDEAELKRAESIICSMTKEERAHYKIINGSRRKRIALGSGTTVFDVNRLINNFEQMKKMMKKMGRGGKPGRGYLQSLLGRM